MGSPKDAARDQQQLQRLLADLSASGVCVVRNARGVALRGPTTPDLVERCKRLKPVIEQWLTAAYGDNPIEGDAHAAFVQKALRLFWNSKVIS